MSEPRGVSGAWLALLAGPVIWFLHFMLVYLVVEAACASGASSFRVLGLPWVSFATLAATILAAGAIAFLTMRAYRLRGDEDAFAVLTLAGVLLGLLFTFAVLFVGLPALFLRPC